MCPKYNRGSSPRCCHAAPASLLLCHSRFAAAVHASAVLALLLLCMALSHHCCCAALALLLLCRSHLAAAVPLSLGSCCMWRSRIASVVALSIAPLLLWRSSYSPHRCCCGALASLLPCRSRLAAVVALLHPSCCGALASLLLWHSSQLISLLLLPPPLWRS